MAKKNIKQGTPAPAQVQPMFDFPLRTKYIILAVIGLIFYGNTLFNEYALDDNGVILGNAYVKQGVGGIFKIMTTDAYDSYLSQLHASQGFTGGRYRPLSIVVFAIEQSLFGDSAFVRHLVNILFFIGTIFGIFYFLSNYLLKKIPRGEDCALLAAALFAIHPLHTEVVANIKSFDEILSLFFIMLTFIFSLKFLNENVKKYQYYAMGCFFLALLSKEYAITLVVLLPMLFYLYPSENKKSAFSSGIPYFITAFLYIVLRFASVGIPHSNEAVKYINNQLRMDPYYLATPIQKFATEWYALGKYLFQLFVPYPLACDYSYNQIPYHNFSNITVWLSIVAFIGLAYWGYKLLKKKDVMALPVFFFLLTLVPISNFFINVGAVYGERFDYHASLGFVIIISWLVFRLTRKVPFATRKMAITGVLGIVMLGCAWETIGRNEDWKNDNILFMHDVRVVPNSEFADCNASVGYINQSTEKGNEKRKVQMLDTAVMYCRRAIDLDKTFPDPFINAGLAYYYLSNLDSAKYFWDIVQSRLYPNHPKVKFYMPLLAKSYLNKAGAEGANNPLIAVREIRKGLSEDSTNAELWYNLGVAYANSGRFDSAKYSWTRTLELKPDTGIANNARGALNSLRSVPSGK
ncbi:MAG TPA: tetratricopeptide repeat protein [Bacteroidia bacterium]|nr:tetratricopeptide repeat protein [Bacteroidia bacterium]